MTHDVPEQTVGKAKGKLGFFPTKKKKEVVLMFLTKISAKASSTAQGQLLGQQKRHQGSISFSRGRILCLRPSLT